MHSRLLKSSALLTSAACVVLTAQSAFGQYWQRQPCPPQPCVPAPLPQIVQPPATMPGQPTQPGTQPVEPKKEDQQAAMPPATDTGTTPEASQAAGGETFAAMMGDLISIPALAFARRSGGIIPPPVPSVRGFKVADNESPRPTDRLYLNFNFFDDINDAANKRAGFNVKNVDAFRETVGFEKTFMDRQASIGMRLPLNHLTADGPAATDRSSTDIGDLSIITKYVFTQSDSGSLLSGGLAVTFPTGPKNFAGSDVLNTRVHTTIFQPYVGFILSRDRAFIHGFSGVQIPANGNDVTLWSNDVGIGYRLRSGGNGIITSVTPTIELHLNTPLNHRGGLDFNDTAGTPDFLNVTTGVTLGLGCRSTLALGFVTPLTGPKPFDFEVLAQLNWRFGPSVSSGGSNILGN